MLNTTADRLSDDDDANEYTQIRSRDYTNDTLSLNDRLLTLETWKQEIGTAAIEESVQLKCQLLEMQEQLRLQYEETLTLKQENASLHMQLDTFAEEHSKLEMEKQELSSQLDAVSTERKAQLIETEHWSHSVQEQYHHIDTLTVRHRRSSVDLLSSRRTVSDLTKENAQMRSDNHKLRMLHAQIQDTVTNLTQSLTDTQQKLAKLQKKYDTDIGEHFAETDKQQNIFQDWIANQLKGKSPSLNDINAALPVPFNPVVSLQRKRSHSISVESMKSNDRLILDHIDIEYDEKEVFEGSTIDSELEIDEKEFENDLLTKYEKEKREMSEKYETLLTQHKELQLKMDTLIKDGENAREKKIERRQRGAMRRDYEQKEEGCWFFSLNIFCNDR